MLLPPSWQAYPGGVGGWYSQEKVAGREDSLVGESWFSGPHSHHCCAHRYFLHFLVGQCSESQRILSLVFVWVVFKKEDMYVRICEGFSEGSGILTWPSTFPGSLI